MRESQKVPIYPSRSLIPHTPTTSPLSSRSVVHSSILSFHVDPHQFYFSIPPCCRLIERLLVREPRDRASLEEIVNHEWLTEGPDPSSPPPLIPLVSREHMTDEQNAYIISRMVEGKIASKEEILRYLC